MSDFEVKHSVRFSSRCPGCPGSRTGLISSFNGPDGGFLRNRFKKKEIVEVNASGIEQVYIYTFPGEWKIRGFNFILLALILVLKK